MIPRNPDLPVRHVDEKSGVVYLLRYLPEDLAERFDEVCKIGTSAKKIKDEKLRNAEYRRYNSAIIDLFLVGWENCSEPFPSDEKPSRYFIGASNSKMALTIGRYINQLIGIEEEDAKN